MMGIVTAFLVGLFVGVALGIVLVALVAMNNQNEYDTEFLRWKYDREYAEFQASLNRD